MKNCISGTCDGNIEKVIFFYICALKEQVITTKADIVSIAFYLIVLHSARGTRRKISNSMQEKHVCILPWTKSPLVSQV